MAENPRDMIVVETNRDVTWICRALKRMEGRQIAAGRLAVTRGHVSWLSASR